MKAFEVVSPPGWTLIDLTGGVDEQVHSVLSQRLARGSQQHTSETRAGTIQAVTITAKTLAAGGAVAMVLADDPLEGLTGMSTAVFMPLTVPDGQDPLDVLLAVAATDPSAEAVDVGLLVSLRCESTQDATESVRTALKQAADVVGAPVGAEGESLVARKHHVRYLMGVPGDPERWVDALFAATSTSLPGSEDAARRRITTFDATIQTFRWLS